MIFKVRDYRAPILEQVVEVWLQPSGKGVTMYACFEGNREEVWKLLDITESGHVYRAADVSEDLGLDLDEARRIVVRSLGE